MSKKISNFTAQTAVPSGSYFTYINGGANYKILDSDYYASLGVTGTITTTGNPLGTPVLNVAGSVNEIRNLEFGAGIVGSLSAMDGIDISSGIIQDGTGLGIFNDIGSSTPTAISVSAGTGIELNKNNGNLVITASGATAATKQVVIRQASDFPAAVTGVRTLAGDTEYFLDGDIDVGSDRFVMGVDTVIRGYSSALSTLTSTTTGALFTAGSGVNFRLKDIAVTVASGSVFSCTGGAFEDAFFNRFKITSCSTIGTFTNWYSLFWDQGVVVSFTNPLTMAGTCNNFIMDLVSFITGYTTAIDLGTATFDLASFQRCGFSYASATNHIIVAANGANLNSGEEGKFFECIFNDGATNIINGFTTGDINWRSLGNTHLGDTKRDLHAYMHTATTTTITGGSGDAGNPIRINGGTNWVIDKNRQFTGTTDGRFTYNGLEDGDFYVRAAVTGASASSSPTYAFYVALNGTIVTASKTQRVHSSGSAGSPAPAADIMTLTNGDYVEFFIENTTGTQDFDTDILNFTITEA